MKPYGIISDSHNHNWSAFATTLETGVNSRLQMILDEVRRCAKEVKAVGGDTIVHAGDMFHVRGSIAPSVLNPTIDCYSEIIKSGMKVVILAGNHDLEGKTSNRISSAITSLEGIGCKVVNSFDYGLKALELVVMIPWTANIQELKDLIERAAKSDPKSHELDLIIHAPIDGIIDGIPPHGLDADYLASVGFKRVFSGHYHNHKDFGNGVYSIGALTHHTWSDVGSKAGFLIVRPEKERVDWRASHTPSFVEITADTDPDYIEMIVDGNYVRAKIKTTKQSDVEETRQFLTECGAKGVVIVVEKDAVTSKRADGSIIKAGATLEASVADFILAQKFSNQASLATICSGILSEARGA